MTTIATSIDLSAADAPDTTRGCCAAAAVVLHAFSCYSGVIKRKIYLLYMKLKLKFRSVAWNLPGTAAGDAGAQYSRQSPGMSTSFTHCHFSRTSPSSFAFLETRQMKYYKIIYLTLCWAVPCCNAMQGRPVARSEQAPSTRLVPKNRLIY